MRLYMGVDKELLEVLLRHTGYMYISDLRRQDSYKRIKNVVGEIGLHQYSAEEWRHAYSYITGTSAGEETEEEIRALFEHLE